MLINTLAGSRVRFSSIQIVFESGRVHKKHTREELNNMNCTCLKDYF